MKTTLWMVATLVAGAFVAKQRLGPTGEVQTWTVESIEGEDHRRRFRFVAPPGMEITSSCACVSVTARRVTVEGTVVEGIVDCRSKPSYVDAGLILRSAVSIRFVRIGCP